MCYLLVPVRVHRYTLVYWQAKVYIGVCTLVQLCALPHVYTWSDTYGLDFTWVYTRMLAWMSIWCTSYVYKHLDTSCMRTRTAKICTLGFVKWKAWHRIRGICRPRNTKNRFFHSCSIWGASSPHDKWTWLMISGHDLYMWHPIYTHKSLVYCMFFFYICICLDIPTFIRVYMYFFLMVYGLVFEHSWIASQHIVYRNQVSNPRWLSHNCGCWFRRLSLKHKHKVVL